MGQRYVCGFLFDSPVGNVALIKKNRGPSNMAGKLNGVGGKMEPHEMSARGAMSREYHEEAGVLVPPLDWHQFHTERYFKESGAVVHFMCATSLDFHLSRTMESEEIVLLSADRDWDRSEFMYNLSYLIPMAQSWLLRPSDRYFEN